MKKILLINPGNKYYPFPPLGLLSIGSFLRANGYEVKIKDYSGIDFNEDDVRKHIETFDGDIVGISVLTGPPLKRALMINKVAKELGKKTIWGGPHPTILPEQTLKSGYMDAIVIGEGEYSFLELIDYFHDKTKAIPNGVGIIINDKIKITNPQDKFVDLKKMPLPAWDLLEDINRYFPNKKHNELPLSTTRGCPFKCGFCHNANENVKKYLGCYRIADPELAIKEYELVQGLVKNKIDILDVGEDLHLVSKEYTRKFCSVMNNSNLNLKWYTSTRFGILDKGLIKMISKSGCIRILYGVESGSKRIQKLCGKIVPFDLARETCKELRKNNIFVINAYIFGHPTETLDDLKKTLKFIKKVPADENLIQMYRPFPATPYFEMALKEDKVRMINNLEGWCDFGVLGSEVDVSYIDRKTLMKYFYRVNIIEQGKAWFNYQKYYLRNDMYKQFMKSFIYNRFSYKLKEFLESRKNETA